LSCPATTTSTSNGVTTTTSYSCVYSAADSGLSSKTVNGTTTTCSGSKHFMTVTQTATPTTNSSGQQYKFPITQTVTKAVTTGTTAPSTVTTLGNTFSCYSSAPTGTPTDYTCASGSTCSYGSATTSAVCPSGKRFQVLGNYAQLQDVATGTFSTDTATYNADEWARFLHNVGVPVGSTKQSVMTYTIDVYNDQPSATVSSLLSSMARNGGGKYFSAQTEAAILSALKSIFAEIQAVNNTFASAALPISATNRAQNSNQVYIGMFRPDQADHPRWFGNLKRYQVGKIGGFDGLVGSDGNAAVSNTTGFVTPCAISYWTTSSTNYWYDTTNDLSRIFITQATSGNSGTAWDAAGNDDNFSKGSCDTTTQWSDSPDGPTVEKGGAAQMLRNNFASRKMYTISSSTTNASSLSTFDTSVTGISANSTVNSNTAKFIMGQDVTGEISLAASTNARPSIHGDVIHSRPLPVDHGGSTGVVIYYGAGDGVYHAVQGSTGQELWGFVAPESYSTLQRLMDNTPLVLTPNPTPPGQTAISGTTGRDFFFDGSTGVYQNSANTKVWIYPAMRRGGRMLYAFDVSSPSSPKLKWRRGCFDLTSDSNCTTGMTGIGQTWSTPQVARVNGYTSSGTNLPVIIVGGGYDTCEDSDTTTPSCSSPKGSAVNVLDADTGDLLKTFNTSSATNSGSGPAARSIAADVAMVDTNGDGIVDYAYAADTGGNLYRIDFPSSATSANDWKMTKVAYTNITPSNSYRKFLFAPAVLPYKGDIFVSVVSGDREHPLALSYPYTTPVLNRAYLYLDDPTRSGATDLDGDKMVNESSGPDCNATKVLPGGTNYGWYMDLKAACPSSTSGCGEQGVTSSLIFGGMVTWSTNRPTGAAETCSTSLGEARGYFVNLLNGSGAIGVTGTCGGTTSTVFPGGGLPPSAVAATVSVDGKEETILIGAPCKDGTSCAPIQAQKLSPPISSKRSRTYWKLNTDNK
jgi:Tfp pilus tip-associated adhesin PilY1